jgi:hypothetical protein
VFVKTDLSILDLLFLAEYLLSNIMFLLQEADFLNIMLLPCGLYYCVHHTEAFRTYFSE